jgi:hypothetical protein
MSSKSSPLGFVIALGVLLVLFGLALVLVLNVEFRERLGPTYTALALLLLFGGAVTTLLLQGRSRRE